MLRLPPPANEIRAAAGGTQAHVFGQVPRPFQYAAEYENPWLRALNDAFGVLLWWMLQKNVVELPIRGIKD